MKAKFIKGTTLHGKTVNAGDIIDLDDANYRLLVQVYRDAEPYVDPAPAVVAKAEPVAVVSSDEQKGKKKV